jgi:hypothetical protein
MGPAPALRRETGIIFASAFPGMASLVDEVTREAATRYGAGAKKRLIEFYTGILAHISDDRERERITAWFTEEFGSLNPSGSEELYTFNRDFLLRVIAGPRPNGSADWKTRTPYRCSSGDYPGHIASD